MTAPLIQRLRDIFVGAAETVGFSPSHPFVNVQLNRPNVYAPVSGTVVYAGGDPTGPWGTHIILQAANGYHIVIGSLADLYTGVSSTGGDPHSGSTLQVGAQVRAGDVIGYEGEHPVQLGLLDELGQWQDPGHSGTGVFWNLYHALGLGSGYNPGQLQDSPAPTDVYGPTYGTIPTGIPGGAAGVGVPDSTGLLRGLGIGGPSGGPTVTPVGYNPTGAGGLLGGDPLGLGALQGQVAGWGAALVLGFLGVALVLAGVFALARGSGTVQKAAQTVTTDTKEAALATAA